MAEIETVVGVPRPPLRPHVTRYTGYRLRTPAGLHRGLPSRHLTLVITIEGTVDYAYPGQPLRSSPALVGGLHAGPLLLPHNGFQYGVEAELTPRGARALFGTPAGELAGQVVDLEVLLGPRGRELVDRLRSATTWYERFWHVDTVLTGALAPVSPPAELDWAWRRLTRTHGRVGIGALADEVGWSRQHLRTAFSREFGLTPKVAARVMRFEAAMRLVVTPARPALADVAVRCGYADQAHLTREWRALTGVSPSTWLTEELPFVQDEPA